MIRAPTILSAIFLWAISAVAPSAAAKAANSTVFVDTTWRAIGPVGDLTGQGINNVGLNWEASHVGWNNNVSFDDSDRAGWAYAIEVMHPNPPLLRYWADGTETIGTSPDYFRKVFGISGTPMSGLLDFNVDDDAQIYVNGKLVFNDANGLATAVDNLDVTAQLHTGLNLIAVKAQDQQGAQGIAGRLDIVSSPPGGNFLLGDFNRDSHVNAADVPVMLSVLADVNLYKTVLQYSDSQFLSIADLNGDGHFSNADLQGLVIYLNAGGGSIAPVPEPGACSLAAVALLALTGYACRTKRNA